LIKNSSHGKIFFGWWTVLVTGILSGLGYGFYTYGVSALFKPISLELNFNRATTSIATGIGRMEGGIEAPLSGWLVDKFGPRLVMFFGLVVAAAGLILMSLINSPLSYFLVWGVIIGTGNNLGLTTPVDKTITNWFIKKRGLALGIKFALLGLGGVVVLPLVTWLVGQHGWRFTCVFWGVLMLIGAPLAFKFVRQKRPEYYGLLPDGARVVAGQETNTGSMIDAGIKYASGFQELEFTLRQSIRTPAYWIVSLAYCAHAIVQGGFTTHCIPFLTDRGISPAVAGSMMGLMVFFTIPARFLGGIVIDRLGKDRIKFMLAGAFLIQALGIGIFFLYPSTAAIYVMLVLFGLGSGASTPFFVIILGRYFGRKAFGSIFGSSALFRAPFQFIAPVYAGWVFDTTGSYNNAFLAFIAATFIAGVIMCVIRAPKAPAHISGINQFI
jgi:cyanate permease